MRLSQSYFFTLREDLKDEESTSGNLLSRAGMIKKSSTGVYMFLPLGLRVMRTLEDIVREEMHAAGSMEVLMPALIPEDVFIESGRRDNFGASMFAEDASASPSSPAHARRTLRGSREALRQILQRHADVDLPVQNKFRDEPVRASPDPRPNSS